MEIIVDGLAKRYRTHWVFRGMSLSIPSGSHTAITGPNGSGKSTLLKVLSGALPPSTGSIQYRRQGEKISPDAVYRHVAFAAPYIDLIDEMSVRESVLFHTRFRPFRQDLSPDGALAILGSTIRATTTIAEMSSGMKQR
ncbi:MAG: ATP-binding cassette domain-containing protein, partial [Saprospiraceae bacterium]|nr:ATP-binding cassette domain-containing protein [Saprospiraceae bacterium]